MCESSEVILWMDSCKPERLVPNRVMMAARTEFIMMNMRDFLPEEYHEIISASGNAAVIRE